MLSISRKLIRTLRAVFRKAGASSDRSAIVAFRTEGDGVRIQFRADTLAVEYRLSEPHPNVALTLPFAALADLERGKNDPIRLRLEGDGMAVAEWTEGGVPQVRRYAPANGDGALLDCPSTMTRANDPSLLSTLTEVVESAGAGHVRFAVHCIHLRGQRGEAIGTDGHQLLIVRGLTFPWDDDVLIPRSPIFACREFAAAESLELGRSETHCVFRAGPWTVWLPIAKDLRYPNVEQIIPGPRLAMTRLSLDRKDANFLASALPRLPGDDDEHSPVTLHLNGQAIVRAKSEAGPITELVLNQSRTEGENVRVHMNRGYLRRAAQLGLLELRVHTANTPIVATDATRTFVWQPLHPNGALGPSTDAVRIESSPTPGTEPIPQTTERTAEPMNRPNSQPQDRPRESEAEAGEETVLDPLQEAEAIRTQLRELLGRTGELVAAIKRQRRQAQLVRSTLASLKQLQEVA